MCWELLGFHWVGDRVSGQTRDKVWSSPGYGEHQLGPQSHFQFAQLCFRVTHMSVANEMSILKIKVLSSLSLCFLSKKGVGCGQLLIYHSPKTRFWRRDHSLFIKLVCHLREQPTNLSLSLSPPSLFISYYWRHRNFYIFVPIAVFCWTAGH